eukprot:6207103-Pleurochrysis_carterae.AAC.1
MEKSFFRCSLLGRNSRSFSTMAQSCARGETDRIRQTTMRDRTGRVHEPSVARVGTINVRNRKLGESGSV